MAELEPEPVELIELLLGDYRLDLLLLLAVVLRAAWSRAGR